MEIFVHSAGSEDAEIVTIEATALVRELLIEGSGDQIWVEERDEAVELEITLEAAGIGHHDHVHRGRCHRVHADVRYEASHESDDVRPTTTIKKLLKWAVGDDGFNLPADQRPLYVLALPHAQNYLDSSVHVGSLVAPGTCDVRLDLEKKDHYNG
jgi:hypothetical protein